MHLFREYGCTLQLAGSDQWGNGLSGVDLIRKVTGEETHVFTLPLIINKATGKKFGKSEDGAVWLDADKTSPYKYYQFWLNADDEGVADYLKVYTLIEKDEFDALMQEFIVNPSDRAAQKYLAYESTKLLHGEEKANSALKVTEVLFGGATINDLSNEEIEMLATEIPTVSPGKGIVQILVETGLASSNGEARRLMSGGAISVNSERIAEDYEITSTSLIKKGKNSFVLVR